MSSGEDAVVAIFPESLGIRTIEEEITVRYGFYLIDVIQKRPRGWRSRRAGLLFGQRDQLACGIVDFKGRGAVGLVKAFVIGAGKNPVIRPGHIRPVYPFHLANGVPLQVIGTKVRIEKVQGVLCDGEGLPGDGGVPKLLQIFVHKHGVDPAVRASHRDSGVAFCSHGSVGLTTKSELVCVRPLVVQPLAGLHIVAIEGERAAAFNLRKKHHAVPVLQIIGIVAELLWHGNGRQRALGVGVGELTGVGTAAPPEHEQAVLAEDGEVAHNKLILQPGVGLGKIKVNAFGVTGVAVFLGPLFLG